MSARVSNIVIEQGANFATTYLLENSNNSPMNLSGYSGVAKLAKHPASSNKTNFLVSITSGSGSVSIAMTSGTTSTLKPGRYLYDVLLTDGSGKKTRVVEGTATVVAGVCT